MERVKAYLLIGLSYVVACAAAVLVFIFAAPVGSAPLRVMLIMLAADAVATVIVWAFGLIFKNSSFYDPYWSLIPWLIILTMMIRYNLFGATNVILLIALGFWSWRLTFNWAYTCENLQTQDWRYTKMKADNKPAVWHILNFSGIHMMPTLFVFAGLSPAMLLVLENTAFNALSLIGAAVIVLATLIELFADISMHRFRKENKDKNAINERGLWNFSRHPNYLGEISVWFGVYLMAVVVCPHLWFTIFGAISMVILFCFISIPMMEKRQLVRRPLYADYQKTTSMLLLMPKRKIKNDAPVVAE